MEKYLCTATDIANITGKSLPAITKFFKDNSHKQGKRVLLQKSKVREYLQKHGHNFDFLYSVHVNLRGASCKSTSTTVIASRLASLGYKVAVLDQDPQSSASLAFGYVSKDEDSILIDVIENPASLMSSLKMIEEGLYLLPSNLGNTVLDNVLGSHPAKQKSAIADLVLTLKKNGFDAVLIDCPPSLGSSVISAIASIPQVGGSLFIPTVSDVFSLKGIQLLTSEAKKIWSSFGLQQPDIKILFARFDGRERLSLEAWSYLQKHTEFSKYLLPTYIKTDSSIPKSQKFGETLYAQTQKSSGKEDYDNLILDLTKLNRLRDQSFNVRTSQEGVENVL